ncbi:alanine/ornithine racemase family PLP-dependent enzyme [Catalinimonas niigatensis]|uniref:alanine/ornithine racemase family PLP-dependent enzyme n=1 Tax=Catalinimonas niigatensis TaxID=1397264 RepID=UPI0026671940|nr:alanine/ornithine racemase family PLP-dependent enzyme [Catalinimonas niigatensis]WPP50532.1 alanine/ornithine racemase family PLP-dependent enzyme [Catalinimonas niigatensis]
MAYIKMKRESLLHNFSFLKDLFDSNDLHWGVVSKLLCGNELFLQELIDMGVREIHDSRISNLKKIKEINADIQTVYIKPPAKEAVEDLIRYADVSMNTEYYTLKWLSDEAVKQRKVHKVIIMIETGDLREGVMGEHLIDFYSKVFELPSIEIIGIGTNLNCLHGVMPSQDKLIQLSLYKQIIELKFNRDIPWISGGTSVTIPLIMNKQIPRGVNHFRVGETLYFGVNLFTEKLIPGMREDVFEFGAQIIEITEKPMLPIGELGANPQGDVMELDSNLYGQTHYRAILDVGLLDLDPKYIIPLKDNFEVVGASSDMLVLDLQKNKAELKVGDVLRFRLKYMGALQLLNSDYIEKRIE